MVAAPVIVIDTGNSCRPSDMNNVAGRSGRSGGGGGGA